VRRIIRKPISIAQEAAICITPFRPARIRPSSIHNVGLLNRCGFRRRGWWRCAHSIRCRTHCPAVQLLHARPLLWAHLRALSVAVPLQFLEEPNETPDEKCQQEQLPEDVHLILSRFDDSAGDLRDNHRRPVEAPASSMCEVFRQRFIVWWTWTVRTVERSCVCWYAYSYF